MWSGFDRTWPDAKDLFKPANEARRLRGMKPADGNIELAGMAREFLVPCSPGQDQRPTMPSKAVNVFSLVTARDVRIFVSRQFVQVERSNSLSEERRRRLTR